MENGNGNGHGPVAAQAAEQAGLSKADRLAAVEQRVEKIASVLNTGWGPLVRKVEELSAALPQPQEIVAGISNLQLQLIAIEAQVKRLQAGLDAVTARLDTAATKAGTLRTGRKSKARDPFGGYEHAAYAGRLRAALQRVRTSPPFLARTLGVTDRTVQRWVKGIREPEGANLAALIAWMEKVEACPDYAIDGIKRAMEQD